MSVIKLIKQRLLLIAYRIYVQNTFEVIQKIQYIFNQSIHTNYKLTKPAIYLNHYVFIFNRCYNTVGDKLERSWTILSEVFL